MYHDDLFNKTAQFLDCLLDDINKGLDGEGFRSPFPKMRDPRFHGSVHRSTPKPETEDAPNACSTGNKQAFTYSIRADYSSADGVITIQAELPGFGKENISVDYCDETITLRATRAQAEDAADNYVENNRRYGTFERRFRVGKVDESTIRAAYTDGILTITCNRQAQASKSITIE